MFPQNSKSADVIYVFKKVDPLDKTNCRPALSEKFNRDLKGEFSHEYVNSCSKYDDMFLKVLNRHALLKKKMLSINHASC